MTTRTEDDILLPGEAPGPWVPAAVSLWAQMAELEYKRHGLVYRATSFRSQFSYVVNGHRVLVRGSNLNWGYKTPRFHWQISMDQRGSSERVPNCDFYHLVGVTADRKFHHWIVPVEEVAPRTQIAAAPGSEANRWTKYKDAWHLLNVKKR